MYIFLYNLLTSYWILISQVVMTHFPQLSFIKVLFTYLRCSDKLYAKFMIGNIVQYILWRDRYKCNKTTVIVVQHYILITIKQQSTKPAFNIWCWILMAIKQDRLLKYVLYRIEFSIMIYLQKVYVIWLFVSPHGKNINFHRYFCLYS